MSGAKGQSFQDSDAPRPSFVKEKHLIFLDDLRESGVTNMYGAAPYLMSAYGMPRDRAVSTLSYWMQTFTARHPETADRRRG